MALKGKVLSFVVKEGKAPSAFIRRLGLSAANVIVGREKLPPWVREPLSWPQNDNTAKCCLAFTNSNTTTQMGMEFKTIHDKIAQIITLSPSVNSLTRKIIEVSSWTLQREEFGCI